jgi:hypothetical protein
MVQVLLQRLRWKHGMGWFKRRAQREQHPHVWSGSTGVKHNLGYYVCGEQPSVCNKKVVIPGTQRPYGGVISQSLAIVHCAGRSCSKTICTPRPHLLSSL